MDALRTRRNWRGTMLVEAAILLPVLLLLTMTVLEYGWIFVKRQQIENACRNGARVGSRHGATMAEAMNRAENLMTSYGFGVGSYTIVIEDAAGAELTTEGDWDVLIRGDPFTMRITVPYGTTGLLENGGLEVSNVPNGSLFGLPVPDNLVSDVTMAVE